MLSTDERKRAAERAATRTGDVEAKARAIAEAVHAGALSAGRARLAAYCGHPPAVAALGSALAALGTWPYGLSTEFAHGPIYAPIRAMVALVHLVTAPAPNAGMRWRCAHSGSSAPSDTVGPVEDWLAAVDEGREPPEHLREEIRRATKSSIYASEDRREHVEAHWLTAPGRLVIEMTARLMHRATPEKIRERMKAGIDDAVFHRPARLGSLPVDAVDAIHNAQRRALVAWALGALA